jgi:hypothetical protein
MTLEVPDLWGPINAAFYRRRLITVVKMAHCRLNHAELATKFAYCFISNLCTANKIVKSALIAWRGEDAFITGFRSPKSISAGHSF